MTAPPSPLPRVARLEGRWGVLGRCPGCGALVWRAAASEAHARSALTRAPQQWCGDTRIPSKRGICVPKSCANDEGGLPGCVPVAEPPGRRVFPWERLELRLAVRQALAAVAGLLSDRDREVLRRRFVLGETLAEVGAASRPPVTAETVRLHEGRALIRLRKAFDADSERFALWPGRDERWRIASRRLAEYEAKEELRRAARDADLAAQRARAEGERARAERERAERADAVAAGRRALAALWEAIG